jgi:phosphoserine phosphatase
MFADFLEIIGPRLGAHFVIGTALEKINGIYSGNIVPPLCFGANKARLLDEFIRKNRLEVDFSKSTAYADSVHDLPVFHMVGNPVATYPDKGLYNIAREQRWAIMGYTNKFNVNHM